MKCSKHLIKHMILVMTVLLGCPFWLYTSAYSADSSISEGDHYEFRGHYYDILTGDGSECLTWDEARLRCEEAGGHLVTIHSREEEDFIFSLTMNRDLMQDWDGEAYQYAWIGGFFDAGEWRWVTGEEWDYPEIFDGALESFGTDCSFLGLCITGVGWNCDLEKEVSGREANEAYHQAVVCEWENPCGMSVELNEEDRFYYTGTEICPDVVVKDNEGNILSEGIDYSLAYTDNVNAGEAEIIVTGMGEYTGSTTAVFTIYPREISECLVDLPEGDTYPYTGEPVYPPVRVTYDGNVIPYLPDLTFDMDYTGVNHTDKGKVIFSVRGQGNLIGEEILTFTIAEAFMWPINDFRISQSFGNYSTRKAKVGRPYHSGVDMVANADWSIYAAGNGIVVYAGEYGANGKHVVIEHTINGKTFKSLYSHLDSITCSTGPISMGTKIGVMGNTGDSYGAHLHFSFFTGASNNPYGYVSTKADPWTLYYDGCYFYDPGYVIEHGGLPDE